MSATNTFETALLNLIFANADIANIGNAGGLLQSSVDGSLYIGLFETAPTDSTAGTETAYTGYAREAVARDATAWTVVNPDAKNTNAITFGASTSGPHTLTSFAIFTAVTGGDMLFYGNLTADLVVNNGITPEISALGLTITAD
jgi:hypothetical protein